MSESLTRSLQEDLLTLLCCSDKYATQVALTTDIKYFEGDYRVIAQFVYPYVSQYKAPPKENLPLVLDSLLEDEDQDRVDRYRKHITSVFDNAKTVNEDYVITRITKFHEQQNLKETVLKAGSIITDTNSSEWTDQVKDLFREAVNFESLNLDPGMFFTDFDKSLAFLDIDEDDARRIYLRIPELDRSKLVPTRKKLYTFVGASGAGKSWFLVHIGKCAILQGLKVLHVSLEMSDVDVSKRYLQSLFALSEVTEPVDQNFFKLGPDGALLGFDTVTLNPSFGFDDPKARDNLRKLMTKEVKFKGKTFKRKNLFENLLIKQFPTSQLTINELIAYMDFLETNHSFIPDILILDYPDIMRLGVDNYRLEIGKIYRELRGLAVERNIAVAVASQSNREGAEAKKMKATNISEDWSKVHISDVILTYSQTEEENALKLARLFVAKGRDAEDKFTMLLSQNYGLGQFCLDSTRMDKHYWDIIDEGF